MHSQTLWQPRSLWTGAIFVWIWISKSTIISQIPKPFSSISSSMAQGLSPPKGEHSWIVIGRWPLLPLECVTGTLSSCSLLYPQCLEQYLAHSRYLIFVNEWVSKWMSTWILCMRWKPSLCILSCCYFCQVYLESLAYGKFHSLNGETVGGSQGIMGQHVGVDSRTKGPWV